MGKFDKFLDLTNPHIDTGKSVDYALHNDDTIQESLEESLTLRQRPLMRDLSNLDRILSTASVELKQKKPVFLALSESMSNSDSCASLTSLKVPTTTVNNRSNIRIE